MWRYGFTPKLVEKKKLYAEGYKKDDDFVSEEEDQGIKKFLYTNSGI